MTDIQIDIRQKVYPAVGQAAPHAAIANFELTLNAGEFVCLVGPSGCGKTTLLNIVAALDQDYDGEIRIDRRQARPKIGYIFQNPRLLPWRTVRENIELVLQGRDAAETVDFMLETMQLTRFQHVYPERLSLGMSRRVAIIRAFAIDPELLLMDEPFVSLDPPTARQVRELLLELWRKRPHTVLFVTHDLREAIALADRLIFLSPSPMSIAGDIRVSIPRHLRQDETEIEAFRRQLLDGAPHIKQLL
ncbi:ATP-binding cassette domain-containing protein [Methylomicrobium sp. Wu6]|uniref:ABC transporter ATP-binding protein n=1 Tax=Methylomicrobium sp. Wu6 TaxID=3107928 RepID=UPI002DD61C2B|nr:ATP-binding cassette domain-containing protein [Methylomicrobium sp. Wu6]MEC4747488.1 ATP-binding cassette domain-containing protein [Methylomicrobium sp. Wu6]